MFCESNGGQKGQEVRLFATFDPQDKSKAEVGLTCLFWADLTYTDKTSNDVATGMEQSLNSAALPATPELKRPSHLPNHVIKLPSGTNEP